MKRPKVQDAALTVLTVCAVATTGLLVRQQFFSVTRASAPGQFVPAKIPDWKRFATSGHAIGEERGSAVVEFADFQCPACRQAELVLHRLSHEHPGTFFVLFRHYPLSMIHPQAIDAAVAAECAGGQGAFVAIHDLFFQHQDSLGLIPWSDWARRAGVQDIPTFEKCLKRPERLSAIGTDTMAGRELGVQGTPTFLINGLRVTGIPSERWFDSLVEAATRDASVPSPSK